VLAAAACALPLVACAGLTERLRESERNAAAANARKLVARRDCAAALPALERAQAARELGAFEAESSWLKLRCLEALGRTQEALAHQRLLSDFHPDFAPIAAQGRAALASGEAPAAPLPLAPAPALRALAIPRARFTPDAERSRVVGEVVVRFRVERGGRVEGIRVLETPHPLLASWAIEAIANASLQSDAAEESLPAEGALRFHFQHRWQAPDADETRDGIEWLPPPRDPD